MEVPYYMVLIMAVHKNYKYDIIFDKYISMIVLQIIKPYKRDFL